MIIKQYAFMSLILLTSMLQAFFRSDDSCFKFYVGGDLGMGIFSIDNVQGSLIIGDKTLTQDIYYTNSKPVFIGGGRVGLAWTGSECWYAAIEGNVHSASRSACTKGEFDQDEYLITSPLITFVDRTRFIAGAHGHFGYKVVEDGALYGIAGYKYLRTNSNTIFVNSDSETINQYECFNNNGWVVGIGGLWNLECNWDVRLEAFYASFGTKNGTDNLDFVTATKTITVESAYQYHPRLFYGVVSIAYNF